MLKKILVVLMLFIILPCALAQEASIKVERNIEGVVDAGGTVDITIDIKFRGTETASIIVTEEFPAGWQLVESTPQAYNFGEGKYKWLIYDEPLEDTTIYYTLRAPESFSQPIPIIGKWITLEDIGAIEGDLVLEPRTPGEEPPQPPADYTLLIILVIVVILIAIIAAFYVMKKKEEKPAVPAKKQQAQQNI